MNRYAVMKISALILGLLLTVVPPGISHAGSISDIDRQIKEEESHKAEIESGIEKLEENIAGLESYLNELNSDLEKLNAELAENQSRMADKEKEIAETDRALSSATKAAKDQYEAMKMRIRFMYETREENFLGIILESESLAEMLNKASYMTEMVSYDREMLVRYNETRKLLEETRQQVLIQQEELLQLQDEMGNKRKEVGALLEGSSVKITEYQDQIGEAESIALQKEENIRMLQIQRMDAITASQQTEKTIEKIENTYVAAGDDLKLLATIIYCEAANQPYEGKLAVGSVILNRVNSTRFSQNTIYDVIFAPGQFAPVASGRFAIRYAAGVNEECYSAAREVLGGNITGSWLFFLLDRGTRTGDVIGDHVFFYYW